MKIQCNCGAKYAFDITPDLAANPIKLVCPTCGLDLSDHINQIVQKELAQLDAAIPRPVPVPVPVPVPIPVAAIASAPAPVPSTLGNQLVPPPPPTGSRLRIGTHKEPTAVVGEPVEGRSGPSACLKHGGQPFVEQCVVCKKPICSACMEEFGYLCSVFCKNKAENSNMAVPVYEGQKSRVHARYWRKIALASTGIAVVVLGLIAIWVWYVTVGTKPHVKYASKFLEDAGGQIAVPEKNQIVLLHGVMLARHDIGKKKEMWAHNITGKTGDTDEEDPYGAFSGVRLLVRNHNIWVEFPNKVVRYDWDTGKPVQEVVNKAQYGDVITHGDEVQLIGFEAKKYSVTRVNLVSGDSKVEEVNATATPALIVSQGSQDVRITGAGSKALNRLTGNTEMSSAAIEQHIQSLPLPARVALPAVLAAAGSQSRIMSEINEQEMGYTPRPGDDDVTLKEQTSFVAAGKSQLQVRIKLLQKNIIERSAMKARPKKAALDGTVNQAATAAIINETVNEWRRDAGEDIIRENESRYQLTLHRLDETNAADWKGEVIGPPSVFPLETVNIVAANKVVLVFDKANKLLWGVTNSFNMAGDFAALDPANSPFGLGPVAERNGILFVADQGVLSAFDLSSGTARWRLPSVGVSGLIFDDAGMLYVNTTTASPDSIKYSKQIDITRDTQPVVLKMDPATGKTLWSVKPRSYVAYASGKYLYTLQMSQGGALPGMLGTVGGSAFESHSTFGIRRLNPKNGSIIWEYFQQRVPADVKFDKNSIQLLFSKEVQVLRYLTF